MMYWSANRNSPAVYMHASSRLSGAEWPQWSDLSVKIFPYDLAHISVMRSVPSILKYPVIVIQLVLDPGGHPP